MPFLSCRKSRCAGTAARWIWPLPPRDFKLPSFVLEFTFEIKANLQGEPIKTKLQYRQVLFLFSKAEWSGRNSEGRGHFISLCQGSGLCGGPLSLPQSLEPSHAQFPILATAMLCSVHGGEGGEGTAVCTVPSHCGVICSCESVDRTLSCQCRSWWLRASQGNEVLFLSVLTAPVLGNRESAAHICPHTLTSALRSSRQVTWVSPLLKHRLPGGWELGRSLSHGF